MRTIDGVQLFCQVNYNLTLNYLAQQDKTFVQNASFVKIISGTHSQPFHLLYHVGSSAAHFTLIISNKERKWEAVSQDVLATTSLAMTLSRAASCFPISDDKL